MVRHDEKINFTLVKSTGRRFTVEISECPTCSCNFHNNPQKTKQNCKHIVWILINKFYIPESNLILAQVPLTKSELGFTFNHKYQESPANCSSSCSIPTLLTEPDKEAIFEAKGNTDQTWHVDQLEVRKNAKYCTCGNTMPPDKIFINFKVIYIPPNQQFAKENILLLCSIEMHQLKTFHE